MICNLFLLLFFALSHLWHMLGQLWHWHAFDLGVGGGIFHFKFERKRKVRRPLFPPKKFVIEKLLDLETLENVFIRVLRFGLFFFGGGRGGLGSGGKEARGGEEAWEGR